jgi:hypothetical protein
MTIDEITQVDSFEPDYDDECTSCGQAPTVVAMRFGQIVARTHLCGPCTWGEDSMQHPREWNE